MHSHTIRLAFFALLFEALLFNVDSVASASPEETRAKTPVLVVEDQLVAEDGPEVKDESAKVRGVSGQREFARLLASFQDFEIRRRTWTEVKAEDLRWARSIVLGLPPKTSASELVERLSEHVTKGTGLVVTDAASEAWPDSKPYSRLLGRGSLSRRTRKPPAEAEAIAVAIEDQRHAITQSLTHFIHRREIRPRGLAYDVVLGDEIEVLATTIALDEAPKRETPAEGTPPREPRARPSPSPVLWLARRGFGRVAVCRLTPFRGPSQGLVRVLLGRAVEWTSSRSRFHRAVTIPLAGDVRWAASALGRGDTGLIPGLPARPGFFRGRQIAQFMTFHGASWLTRADRQESEEPDRVLDSLKIQLGNTVCDFGCGNGYFTLRMAERVGKTGRVLAVDIQKEMLELLSRRADATPHGKVIQKVLATETDPKLPADSIDLLLMVDVYHEISRPDLVLPRIRKALKKTGRLVLVEYRGEDPSVPIKHLHRMTESQARAELAGQGFRWLETKSFLKHQHVLIFGKTED